MRYRPKCRYGAARHPVMCGWRKADISRVESRRRRLVIACVILAVLSVTALVMGWRVGAVMGGLFLAAGVAQIIWPRLAPELVGGSVFGLFYVAFGIALIVIGIIRLRGGPLDEPLGVVCIALGVVLLPTAVLFLWKLLRRRDSTEEANT
jgi:hypothetical protein